MTNQNSRERDDFEIFIPLQLEDMALKLGHFKMSPTI